MRVIEFIICKLSELFNKRRECFREVGLFLERWEYRFRGRSFLRGGSIFRKVEVFFGEVGVFKEVGVFLERWEYFFKS